MTPGQTISPSKDLLLQWQAELGYCIAPVEVLSYITTRAIVWDRARRDQGHTPEVLSEDDSWITDRLPTKTDGDFDEDVTIRTYPGRNMQVFLHWSQVGPGIPWRHTDYWVPPAQPDHVEVLSEAKVALQQLDYVDRLLRQQGVIIAGGIRRALERLQQLEQQP